MIVELDHVFFCCDAGAPEADFLRSQGLREGSGNVHPGQGTANRRFFFSNAYLELLWVSDAAEAQSAGVLPAQLWVRWLRRRSGACPFGIVYRPRSASAAVSPFPAWSYRPSYLPSGLAIEVGRDMPLAEPQLFYLPFARSRDGLKRQPTEHPAGIGAIAGVSVTLPAQSESSETLRCALAGGLLAVAKGPEYHLEIAFTGEGRELDLRPDLPLTLTRQRAVTRR
jgi:hypothetical protein